MLRIEVEGNSDYWDPVNETFIAINSQTLVLEHSLVSVSKWEAKWKKPFISNEKMTVEELKDYIRCMTINNVNSVVYDVLTPQQLNEIEKYIEDPMSATKFFSINPNEALPGKSKITSEEIYYTMISLGIPIELEKWHLNRLMTLIRVFTVKDGNSKKMSRRENGQWQRSMNEQRLRKKR